MLERTKRYTLIIGATVAVSVPYGQYFHPIPLEPRSGLPVVYGDALPNLDFIDDGFEQGYSDNYRRNMDKLVASSIKPVRK